jgi:hypothetical protein
MTGMITVSPVSRQLIYSFAFAISAINALVRPVLSSFGEHGWLGALLNSFDIGFVIPGAFLIGLKLFLKPRDDNDIESYDWLLIILALVILLIPSSTVAWLVMAALSAFAMSRFTSPWARAGLSVILFTAIRDPLTTTLLKLFATPLLEIDAAMTAMLLNLFIEKAQHQGNVVTSINGHQLLILTGCTSYTNLSMALLGWFALSRNFTPTFSHHQALAGLFIATTVIGLNIVRLTIMALGPSPYYFFHDGTGGVIFEITLLVLTVGLTLNGVRNDEPERDHNMDLRCTGYSWVRRQGYLPHRNT